MRETVETRKQLKSTVMFVMAMIMMMLVIGMTTIISHAEEGKVTASSVKIRASADTNSEMIGGAMQGDILPITGEVPDADGVHTWYQVTFEETRTGYVRSDFMQKVTGGGTGASTPATNPSTPATNPSTVVGEVTALQPVSAKVTGGQVRVRSNASTSGTIVSTVQRDAVLTVVGMAQDSEQKTWYQVNFSDASGQLSGFVREDFVSVEGEIIPADQVPAEPDPPVTDPVEPVTTPEPEPVHKDYDTQFYNEQWYLADYTQDEMYPISELLEAGPKNKALYEEAQADLKSTKIIMIILVVLVVVLALATTLLFFKVRDMMDAAYFEEVEQETMRKRQSQKPSGRASMPTVGAGSRASGGAQQKSSGSGQPKPSGSGQQRPAGSGGQR
ncbi:MAG: SH3 domain-containing protein, partial [Acetatifactor sp.]|nr:SH3 domain-containing protein [Acetatifactor sp.]